MVQIGANSRHDPFGRRIAKTVKRDGQTKTTYYIYSEQGLMAEADEKGQMIKAYGFNPVAAQQGLWSTDPVWQAETPNGSLTDPKARYDWLHTDHLGTPILATTKEGQTSWKAIAESFGATQIIEQDIEVNLRFPGQYFDAETGTYYNFHRDYRPNAGRYLQSDPIGVGGGGNVYGYVDNNALIHTDPIGLIRWDGAYVIWSAGISRLGAGLSVYTADFALSTKCVNRKKGFAAVKVFGLQGGGGLSILGPFSGAASSVWFEDGLASVNPDIFNGQFEMHQLTLGFVYGISNFIMGGASGRSGQSLGKRPVGQAAGMQASTDLLSFSVSVLGSAVVTSKRIVDCCE